MAAKTVKIFISHSAHSAPDREFLKQLVGRLEKANFQVYWDCERLKPGDVWPNELFSAIGCCHGAVVLVTQEALDVASRPWVFQECSMLTILKWADKEFPVVPVLMTGVTPAMVKASPFAELRFQDIQAGSCQDIDRVEREIIDRLSRCGCGDEDEPLYHHHRRIATRLGMVKTRLLQSVIDRIEWPFDRWDTSGPEAEYRLARILLTLKSNRVVDALSDVLPHLGPSQARVLLDMLAPFWFDLRASARLDDVVQTDQRWVQESSPAPGRKSKRARTSFWLNGAEPLIAKMYASRAGYMKKYPYTIITPPPDAGTDEVGRFARHIIAQMNTEEVGLIQDPKTREELALQQAIERPTFVIIPPKTGEETIEALRQRFWPFIFIVLTGGEDKGGRTLSKFQMLEPLLKAEAERDMCLQFTAAQKTAKKIIEGA